MNKETGRYLRCWECGREFDLGYVQRREALLNVQTLQYWFRFSPLSWKLYGKVDMCPGCAAYVDEMYRRQRRMISALLCGGGVFLVGAWNWGVVVGGVGVAISLVLFSVPFRSKKVTVLPAERENHA